ncbi:Tn3 family transposase [Streptomyces sp. NPDC054765]
MGRLPGGGGEEPGRDGLFALFDLVGMQLSPRIRDLGKITLYRMDPQRDVTAAWPATGRCGPAARSGHEPYDAGEGLRRDPRAGAGRQSSHGLSRRRPPLPAVQQTPDHIHGQLSGMSPSRARPEAVRAPGRR